jgi:hypothetical protein
MPAQLHATAAAKRQHRALAGRYSSTRERKVNLQGSACISWWKAGLKYIQPLQKPTFLSPVRRSGAKVSGPRDVVE